MMRDVERLMAMVQAKNIDAFPWAIADALCNGVPCDECPYYPENPCFDLLYNDVKTIMGKGCGDNETQSHEKANPPCCQGVCPAQNPESV